MAERPTADIVADVEAVGWTWQQEDAVKAALERLAELDAEVKAERQARYEWSRRATESAAALFNQDREVDALRPPCPTCGGTHRLNVGEGHPAYGRCKVWTEDGYICPDCEDGKVSIEQLAATWRAVETEWERFNEIASSTLGLTELGKHARNAVAALRAVKP